MANIEAKADEPFGELTGEYYDKRVGTSSNVPRRIASLATTLFGQFDERIRGLRYQLLHATAATLISAQACGAESAVFVVHEFNSASLDGGKVTQNRQDWAKFVCSFSEAVTPNAVEGNHIIGPIRIPNLTVPTLFLGHLVTAVSYANPNREGGAPDILAAHPSKTAKDGAPTVSVNQGKPK